MTPLIDVQISPRRCGGLCIEDVTEEVQMFYNQDMKTAVTDWKKTQALRQTALLIRGQHHRNCYVGSR